jgi:hypothetical protein
MKNLVLLLTVLVPFGWLLSIFGPASLQGENLGAPKTMMAGQNCLEYGQQVSRGV